ncbi:discoidin domain-containing protein [Lysinibacillus sp. M3]|uniref:Discoidin domain-containing protein n=1 Tax=Lysinibacillus zambalensis TaxID=3160866 RepID=A0ABV1MYA2_9BACI
MIKSIRFTVVRASSYYVLGGVRLYDLNGLILPIKFTNNYDAGATAYFHIENKHYNSGKATTTNVYSATSYAVDNAFDTSTYTETDSTRNNYWLSGSANYVDLSFDNPIALSKIDLRPYCGDGASRKINSVTIALTMYNGEVVTKTFDTSSYIENEKMTIDLLAMLEESGKSYNELFLMKNISTNKIYSTDVFRQEYLVKMTSNTVDAYGGNITVSASSVYSVNYLAWKAFRRGAGDSYGWVSLNGKTTNQWLQIDYGERKYVNWVRLTSRNYNQPTEHLKSFDILGSYDGVNWKVVGEFRDVPSWGQSETREYKLQFPKDYRYYRVSVIANQGYSNYVTIGDVVFGYTSIVELDNLNEENYKKYGSSEIRDFNMPLGSIIKPIHKEQIQNNNVASVTLGERPKSIKLIKR